jgi:carboxymethylenebutenolidase
MVDAVALGAADALADLLGESTTRIGALGFSLGAAWALWLPAQRAQVAATVVYYGSIAGPSLSRAATPVLGHFAETDPYEPDEGLIEFERALRAANREVDVHRYPGTGHWFAEPSREAYVHDAAELAFDRTIDFLRRHLLEGG